MDYTEEILNDFLYTEKLDKDFIEFVKAMIGISIKEGLIDKAFDFSHKMFRDNPLFDDDEIIDNGIMVTAIILMLLNAYTQYKHHEKELIDKL